jgi:colanic acid biosynthesis glycosyl transferase WcaI
MPANGDPRPRCRRIAVHDYCGHPFQFDLSRELARRGHEVRHFFFAEDMGPKGKVQRSSNDPPSFSVKAISIDRPYSKQNLIRRHQADTLYGKLASRIIASFEPDVTISGNTPLDAQAAILEEVHRAGSAFVFWMQDFYSLAAARILGRKMPVLGHAIGAYYKHLEARMLCRSDGVVLISGDFKPALDRFGVESNATEVIPNWGALQDLQLRPKNTAWAKKHGLSDKFVFLYSGTLALKHDPNMLWALAERFDYDPKVALVVVASGVNFEALKARCASEPKPNLVLLPLQPMAVFPDVLGSADAFIALLEKDAGPWSVPSKILSYLCAGRPVLLSAPLDNLAVRVIEEAAAGICVPAEDRDSFVEAAVRLRNESQTCLELGRAGRAYAERAFNISAIADRFECILTKAIVRHRGRESSAGASAGSHDVTGAAK